MRNLVLLVALLQATSGCFSTGIPEVYLGKHNYAPAKGESTLAVVAEGRFSPSEIYRAGVGHSGNSHLGFQFFFGLFPLTRLYLQHTVEGQLKEIFTREAYPEGLDVVFIPAELAPSFPAVLELRQTSFSVNAYDFLFFRRLSVQGELEANLKLFYSGKEIELVQEISSSSFVKAAHLNQISLKIDEALAESARALINDIKAKLDNREMAKWRSWPDANSVQPEVSVLLDEEKRTRLTSLFAESYGPGTSMLYPEISFERIMQRGMEPALEEAEMSYVSSLGGFRDSNRLKIVVRDMDIQESGLNISASLYLLEGDSVLLAGPGETFVEFNESSDAGWFASLERASFNLTSSFLGYGKR